VDVHVATVEAGVGAGGGELFDAFEEFAAELSGVHEPSS